MEFGVITTTTKKPLKERFLKALSVIGGIAILVGVVWVGMQGFRVLPNARTLVANAVVSVQSFFTPAERIVVSVIDSQVVVDESFDLAWEHRGKNADGSYSFFYECRDGIHLALNDDTVFCNTELPLLSTQTTLSLTPRGTIDGTVAVPVEVRFRENNDETISERGELTITVQDERFDEATSTTATTTPTTSSTNSPQTGGPGVTAGTPTTITYPVTVSPTSDPNGDIDLRVEVLAYGLVHRTTGVFEEMDEIPRDLPSNKRGAIKFVVENIGTKASGEWEFEAELPTSPSYTFDSRDQDSLFPGDKIEFIIGFDRIRNVDEDDYRIEVDPSDDIDESRENNNVVNGTIEIDR